MTSTRSSLFLFLLSLAFLCGTVSATTDHCTDCATNSSWTAVNGATSSTYYVPAGGQMWAVANKVVFQAANSVFPSSAYIVQSTDASTVQLVSTAPWNYREEAWNGQIGNTFYFGGGQDQTNGTYLNDIWRSTDYGVTWSQLGHAPWLQISGGTQYDLRSVTFNGVMYVTVQISLGVEAIPEGEHRHMVSGIGVH